MKNKVYSQVEFWDIINESQEDLFISNNIARNKRGEIVASYQPQFFNSL